MTKDEYIAVCMKHGEPRENAEHTWELMDAIERILDDRDIGGFMPPEMVRPKKARLARLFIDRYAMLTRDGDKAIAAWLRELAPSIEHEVDDARACDVIAEKIDNHEHWKWAQQNREKWDTKQDS